MPLVYFVTNRKPNRQTNPDDFGSEFSPDGLSNIRFGKAMVTGSKLDQVASVEVAKENLKAAKPILGSANIFQAAQQQMLEGGCDVLILIHGFNVSFRTALISLAQLTQGLTSSNPMDKGKSLKLLPVVFSWPSDGTMLFSGSQGKAAYQNDRQDAATSGPAFARAFLKMTDFIQQLAPDQQCNRKIHLVAHSMGNYVLRNALQEIRRQIDDRFPRIFDQVLMMAADEDDDAFEFEHKLLHLPRLTTRTTVYFNRGDIALWASDTLKGNVARLGSDGPMHPQRLPRNVYPVDCTQILEEAKIPKEHGYHIVSPRVVADMRRVLRGEIPDEIQGRKFVPETMRYRLLSDANAPQQR
jgi:esterase/lipase superfamily enzyme